MPMPGGGFEQCYNAQAVVSAGSLLADNGYFSEANVEACQAAGINPLIALGR